MEMWKDSTLPCSSEQKGLPSKDILLSNNVSDTQARGDWLRSDFANELAHSNNLMDIVSQAALAFLANKVRICRPRIPPIVAIQILHFFLNCQYESRGKDINALQAVRRRAVWNANIRVLASSGQCWSPNLSNALVAWTMECMSLQPDGRSSPFLACVCRYQYTAIWRGSCLGIAGLSSWRSHDFLWSPMLCRMHGRLQRHSRVCLHQTSVHPSLLAVLGIWQQPIVWTWCHLQAGRHVRVKPTGFPKKFMLYVVL